MTATPLSASPTTDEITIASTTTMSGPGILGNSQPNSKSKTRHIIPTAKVVQLRAVISRTTSITSAGGVCPLMLNPSRLPS